MTDFTNSSNSYKLSDVYDDEGNVVWEFKKGADAVLNGPNQELRRNVFVPGEPDHFLWTDIWQGSQYYVTRDGLGSVREVTDGSQTIYQRYDYSAYGKTTLSIPTPGAQPVRNPYAFTSREYEAELGIYYYRARYYDPDSGRFLSEDPIGFAAGDTNLYRYVFNQPTNLTDPLGLLPDDPAYMKPPAGLLPQPYQQGVNAGAVVGATAIGGYLAGPTVVAEAQAFGGVVRTAATSAGTWCLLNPKLCQQIGLSIANNVVSTLNGAKLPPNPTNNPIATIVGATAGACVKAVHNW